MRFGLAQGVYRLPEVEPEAAAACLERALGPGAAFVVEHVYEPGPELGETLVLEE